MIIQANSFAKLNLFLKVYGKRPDGFHDIISIMQSVGLYDTLTLESVDGKGKNISITCTDAGVPTDEKNIVWKAVEIFSESIGLIDYNLKIHIEKNIPVMGGLAGGSSNAAATLFALKKLWKPDFPDEKLFKIGAKVGSDVPFCLLGGTALVQGRGEVLEPLPEGVHAKFPGGAFLLVMPPVSVETGPAYDAVDAGRIVEARKWNTLTEEYRTIREVWISAISSGEFAYLFHNDFQVPVFGYHHELEAIHTHLRNHAGHAVMSGSGSTMFAWFPLYTDAFDAKDSYIPLAGEKVVVALPVGHGVRIEGGLSNI